ncbi:MAG: alcohol dehydrogenase catalytic domain-containing protein [Pseudomonadota bacterium]
MKALVYDGVEQMGYREIPDAEPREGEHLIRVAAVGICGSDMHAYLGHDDRRPAPLILGHEAAGVIVKKERSNPQKGEPGQKAKDRAEEKAAKAAEADAPAEEAPAEEATAEEAPAEAEATE